MPFTTIGYSESQDTGGVLVPCAAIPDDHVRVEGDNIVVPDLNELLGYISIGATITLSRITSPSLRALLDLDVSPLNLGAEPLSPPSYVDHFDQPIPLVKSEQLRALVAEGAAGAERENVFVFIGDGSPSPVGEPFYTVRATATTTLVAFTWTNCAITFDQILPAGAYEVIGFAALSTGLLAARLVFPGYAWRPGVIGHDALSDIQAERFRFGNAGVFGTFTHDSPPTVDCCSVSADTAETFYLDLVKVG